MPNLLLVTYSGGIQKCRTVGGLAEKYDYDVTMLTTGVSSELREELPDLVEVLSVPDPYPLTLYRPVWIASALGAARRLPFEEFDAVLSWHVPIASHLVAAALERRYGLPWVAHFGDPWIGSPYAEGFLRKLFHLETVERYIATRADALTFPTPRMCATFADRYGVRERCHVVPNNIDPSEVEAVEAAPNDADAMVMVHTGSFYGVRSPEPLFHAIRRLDEAVRSNVELRLVGDLNEYEAAIEEYGVDDVVRHLGRVPKNEAIREAKASDVLVLIDAPVENSPFLPTKLAEYVFLDRPILGITPDPGTSADVIRETNTGVVAPVEDSTRIAKAISDLYCGYAAGGISYDPDRQAIQRYSASEAVGKLADVLGTVTTTSP